MSRLSFEYTKEIKEDITYAITKHCIHFDIPLYFSIKNGKFEEYSIGLKCLQCKNETILTHSEPSFEHNYNCEKCGNGSIFFSYKISDINDRNRIYITPNVDKAKKEEEKINVIIFYKEKIFNFVVDRNNKVEKYYNAIRDKIQFPHGKRIFVNSNVLDQSKTFKECGIFNCMKLEIGD